MYTSVLCTVCNVHVMVYSEECSVLFVIPSIHTGFVIDQKPRDGNKKFLFIDKNKKVDMLERMPGGPFYFEIAMILRNTLLISSIL